ncbi:MAG: AraC family transcriptional regulator [Alphaproteobacteria bacterium]|nr:AraC family transcriptional regulator [Alphaproteobacteria bacterium]
MGDHAFEHDPEHCAVYRGFLGSRTPALMGLDKRWNIPTARHRAELAGEAPFPGVDHYVMTFHIGGGKARRVDRPDLARVAEKGALSLQAPGSSGVFSTEGVVDYAHLYFRQSLLCEVADNTTDGVPAEVTDFFGIKDTECAAAVKTYVTRAADPEDIASPIEMDSRAYLIALDLLRANHRRLPLKQAELLSPSDTRFRRVLQIIEDRMAEPLRISELAREMDMSSFQFLRAFRESIGVTPGKYIAQRRAERARDLIAGGDLPLAEIAHRVGYSSQSHMTRKIGEVYGMSPKTLRMSRD